MKKKVRGGSISCWYDSKGGIQLRPVKIVISEDWSLIRTQVFLNEEDIQKLEGRKEVDSERGQEGGETVKRGRNKPVKAAIRLEIV